ncbi:vicilin seed storage protein [Trifolium repens]|nr:vicilin seed storage protein [Trifolium repens]
MVVSVPNWDIFKGPRDITRSRRKPRTTEQEMIDEGSDDQGHASADEIEEGAENMMTEAVQKEKRTKKRHDRPSASEEDQNPAKPAKRLKTRASKPKGEAKVGFMYENRLAERKLKKGDVYQIPAGSAFYLSNTKDSQKLHIVCSIDPSESLGLGIFQSFYIGGGSSPVSVLSGFQPQILESAFNVSESELKKLFSKQHEGPIVHVGHSHSKASSLWTKFLQLKEDEKLHHMKKMLQDQEENEDNNDEVEKKTSWSWRKLLESVFGDEIKNAKIVSHKSPHSVNLYDRKPDFKNSYGWSVALDGSDYSPLKSSGIGIYHVNLKPGSMMTPHVNPRATEYGIVVKGSGRIQIVFPNGSNAMDTSIKEGDVFFVPRYFAFSQIASSSEQLDFFGFTTSAKKNKPQFLVGATSLMKTLMGPELAAAFGVSEDTMENILNAQHEGVIIPTQRDTLKEKNYKKNDLNLEMVPKIETIMT